MVSYGDSDGETENNIQRIIVNADGFRLELVPTGNRAFFMHTEVYPNNNSDDSYQERSISFSHPAMAHEMEIIDRSEGIPNPTTQKQRDKVREFKFANNAIMKGITYEIVR